MSKVDPLLAVYPFHCGTQYGDWEDRNCNRCAKGATPGGDDWPTCPMQEACLLAYFDDGSIAADLAQRLGYDDGWSEREDAPPYTWDCPEREDKP